MAGGRRAGTIPQLTDESHFCDLNDEAFRRLFCSPVETISNLNFYALHPHERQGGS